MIRCALLLLLLAAPAAWPQRAVSARAGLIHYLEREVYVDGKRVQAKVSRFTHLNEGQLLTTSRAGRVEILLNPTSFLRVGENSSVRLLSSDLGDTRVELLSGSAMIEIDALENKNAVALQLKDRVIAFPKSGLYHLVADGPGRLRVYDGEAHVPHLEPAKLKKGWQLVLDAAPSKFDRDDADALYRWNTRRSRAIDRTNPVRRLRSAVIYGF